MIELKNLNKTYHLKEGDVKACIDVDLSIPEGEIYGIIGYSGAGKSSLVRCINLLETPDSGEVEVDGEKLTWMENDRMKVAPSRVLKKARKNMGMIFQHFNLLDRSTVFENVAYPLKFSGYKRVEIEKRVNELLELVGLLEKADIYPSQLSGGQKQRVAIARALASSPKVLLSDEATSALDPDATESILNLLKELNKKLGLTIVLITHEMAVIKSICHKVAVMENGRVVEEGDVYDIFANPKQLITKKFIASQSSLSKIDSLVEKRPEFLNGENGVFLKLQFEKESVGDALISDISRRFNINVNIILANVEMIQDDELGAVIVVFKGEKKNIDDAVEYVRSKNVKVFDLASKYKNGGNKQ